MLRRQGLSILAQIRDQIAAHQLPTMALLEGLLLLVGGALLLTPGFVTDAVGVFCLLPTTRRIVACALASRFAVWGRSVAAHQSPARFRDVDSKTIEGE